MKLSQVAQIGFIVLAAIAVYSFVVTAREAEERRLCGALCHLSPNYAARNRLAPDFELPSTKGGKVRLSDYRGKTVVLNFWTKTCPPCLEEMPSLAELARLLDDRDDIVVLTVSTDESVEDVKATLQSILGGSAPFVTAVDAEGEVVTDKYGTKLFPETWFIDPDGVIRARFDGPRQWSDALTVEFASSLGEPLSCKINFVDQRPTGAAAGMCRAISG